MSVYSGDDNYDYYFYSYYYLTPPPSFPTASASLPLFFIY